MVTPNVTEEQTEIFAYILSKLPFLQKTGAVAHYTAGPDHIYIRLPSAKKESIFKRIFNKATMPINK